MTPTPPDFVRDFAKSMGSQYRGKHHEGEIAEHAGAAFRRRDEVAHVELVSRRHADTSTICVVADDRPGLLALISAAFVLSELDVVDAEAYTRQDASGRLEAVDFFEVRNTEPSRRAGGISPAKVEELQRTLLLLLRGELSTAEAEARAVARPLKETETTVRFLENADGQLATLEVETDDRSGLLLALAEGLYKQQVQIIASQVRTRDGRVSDRFDIVEVNGRPISAERRLQIQLAVLSALGR